MVYRVQRRTEVADTTGTQNPRARPSDDPPSGDTAGLAQMCPRGHSIVSLASRAALAAAWPRREAHARSHRSAVCRLHPRTGRRSIGRLRGRHLLVLDTVGILLAAYTAVALRNFSTVTYDLAPTLLAFIGTVLVVRTVVDIWMGLYSHDWRFASVPDMARIVVAIGLGTVVTAAIVLAVGVVHRATSTPFRSPSGPSSC